MTTTTKNTETAFVTTIAPDDCGLTVVFEHFPSSTYINIIWKEDGNFDGSNTDLEGEDGSGCKWVEVLTTGDCEAAGLIEALVKLGDQLRPIHEQMKRETQNNMEAPTSA